MKNRKIIGVLIVVGVLCPSLGIAQVCTLVNKTQDGRYKVQIEEKTYATVDVEGSKDIIFLTEKIEDLQKKLDQADALIRQYETTIKEYESQRAHQREYVTTLESVRDDYKKLAEEASRLNKGSIVTFEVGLGATNEDLKPAVMAGLGLWRFRIWGFVQEKNPGVLLGASLPIF